MSRLLEVLSKYEDFELAFLTKYKLDSYMRKTREKVEAYINERGLSSEKISDLIFKYENKSFTDDEKRCPRCKSLKILTEKEEWSNTLGGSGFSDEIARLDGFFLGKKTEKNQKTCLVCGFLVENPNNENWTRQINVFFWKKWF